MKRIISLIMSVLMIATMFCGFAVTSTADDVYDATTNLAHVTVEAGEVAEDGTFTVSVWVKDNSPYGYYGLSFYIKNNEYVEPVQASAVTDGSTAYFSQANFNNFVNMMTFGTMMAGFQSKPGISNQTAIVSNVPYAMPDDVGTYLAFMSDATYKSPVKFNNEYITNDVVGNASLANFAAMYPITVDAEKGLLWATATYKVVDESGVGKVWAEPYFCKAAIDDGVTNGNYDGDNINSLSRITATTDATIGEDTSTPTLPAGITLNVDDVASIRNTDPAGLRFQADVTATDFSVIDQMGVAIVKEGTTPGVDTTLKIPARVNTDGDYLHNWTYDENEKKVFDGPVTAENGTTVEFTGVLSDIKEANLTQDFTAYAYVIVDGVTYFSEAKCTRNHDAVAEAVAADVDAGIVG